MPVVNSKTSKHTPKRNVEDGSPNMGWIAAVVIVPLLTLLVMLWILVRQLRGKRKRSRRSSTSSQPVSVNLALPAPVYGSTTDTISSTTGVFGNSPNPYADSTSSTTGPDETWKCPTCGTTNVTGTYVDSLQNRQATYYHDFTNCPRCMARVERTERQKRRDRDMRRECLDRYLQQKVAYNTPQPGLSQYCYSYQYLATAQQKDEYWYRMNQTKVNHVPENAPWTDLNGLQPVYRRDRGGNRLVDAFAFQTA